MPLHLPLQLRSIATTHAAFAIPILMACIDMSVIVMHMQNVSMEAGRARLAYKKKTKREVDGGWNDTSSTAIPRHECDEETLEFPHENQILDLLAWHIHGLETKWYVKPRSTCWFEEYLFNIYTPDMFYDILRMRRRTFDRSVHDLRPFIQGQHTHWRHPIGVEKKVVVTLFKLMHGVSIPLVADKAALGKSTVHGILRQVCLAISQNFGHLIAWPIGQRLARVTTAFK